MNSFYKSSSENETQADRHFVSMENRQLLTISGVSDVDSFNESAIMLYTSLGELTIKGRGLHVNAMNVQTGDMEIEGDIWALMYGEKDRVKKPGLINKIFR